MTISELKTQSLIPYLDPENEICLKIPLRSEDPAVFEKTPDPFLKVVESGSFARIVEAQFTTNAGGRIKRVFLLIQKDEYLYTNDDLWPVNNLDVEQCWQNALLQYSDNVQDDSVILLSGQIKEEGGLMPFGPLFFCKSKQIFFHPLCPRCGAPLQQCYDDNLLTGHGLQPYSSSIKRYLFCPTCSESGEQVDFYVASLDSHDPTWLKDFSDLIRAFASITEDSNSPDPFPCARCTDRQECYGADCPATSRIVPFSFYPFHMFIFEAMSVNAVDFLPLISGASFEEVETHLAGKQELGRINCLKALQQSRTQITPFFFDRDDRYFLEVLYLKLSFLGELISTVSPELIALRGPDPGLTIDRIWVKLADQGGLLPFFWNFRLRLMDIGGYAPKTPSLQKAPPSYGFHFLGRVWYYTFLVNMVQDISAVYGVLGQAIEETELNDDAFNSILRDRGHSVFSPENVFWNPENLKGRPLDETWKSLWEESLCLGWPLLKVGMNGETQWSESEFFMKLEDLRSKIKDNLFKESVTVPQADPVSEDKAIFDILTRIMGKWNTESSEGDVVSDETVVLESSSEDMSDYPEGALEEGEGDVQHTVILSSEDIEKGLSSFDQEMDAVDETVILPKTPGDMHDTSDGLVKEGADVPQTVIISPENLPKETSPPVMTDDKLDETVVLSPGSFEKEAPTPLETKNDDVPETVIISSSDLAKAGLPYKSSPDKTDDHQDEAVVLSPGSFEKESPTPLETKNDDVPETVIISSSDLVKAGIPYQSSPDKPDDHPDEAVVLSPGSFEKESPTPLETKNDDVPETVIISSSDLAKAGIPYNPSQQVPKQEGGETGRGSEEVEKAEEEKDMVAESSEGDSLDKTVIIRWKDNGKKE